MARHTHRATLRSQTGGRMKSVPENVAWDLVWTGWAKVTSEVGKPLQIQLLSRQESPGKPSRSSTDKAGITAREMEDFALARAQRLAGVKIARPEMPRVCKLEEKIVAYWEIGDTLAVRVGRASA